MKQMNTPGRELIAAAKESPKKGELALFAVSINTAFW